MSEWLSEVHSIMNDVGSFPFGVDSNLANPAFPKMRRGFQIILVLDCKKIESGTMHSSYF